MNLRRILTRTVDRLLHRQGFRFRCRGCGDCCSRPGSVYFTAEEMERLLCAYPETARRLFVQLPGDWYEIPCHTGCPFQGRDGRCTVYEVRPFQCSSWPFWPENFRTDSEHRNLLRECPGSGSGKYHTPEEVKQLLSENGPQIYPD